MMARKTSERIFFKSGGVKVLDGRLDKNDKSRAEEKDK